MMPKHAVNAWRCPDCGKPTVARHADEGVTPMFLACRATDGCNGRAVSLGYPSPLPDDSRKPAWEWYRPTPKKARLMGPEMAEHVKRGGLALRALRSPEGGET